MRDSPRDSLRRSDRTNMRWRHRFSILTVVTLILLLAMGGFVTSINAGLAVPDWPTSFGSMDPFFPLPDWWRVTPVFAEHGHRLLGALIGFFTTVLALWTWWADHRRWMRRLGFFALGLVIFQGVLGGLRVVWISLDLAVVHACTAQLFFATVLAMTVFTSPSWLKSEHGLSASEASGDRLPLLTGVTAAVIYLQIILGALLRHPGAGISTGLAYMHIAGAVTALILIAATGAMIRRQYRTNSMLQRHRLLLYGLAAVQVALGIVAYVVLLDETGRLIQPSTMQVTVNTSHVVVGALLFGTAASLNLWVMRGRIKQHLRQRAARSAPRPTPSPSEHTQLA